MMSGQAREILLRIATDTKRAIDELDNVGDGIKRVGKSADSVKDSLARMGHAAAAAWSAGSLARASDTWTGFASKMALVSPSAESAATSMAQVFDVAQKTGQSLDSVSTVFQRISQNALQYNLSQQKTVQITQAVANAVTLSGASAEGAQAALMQFGQALASGQLRGEELNSVMEQTPALAEAIARGMGKSVGDLKKLGEEGALAAKDVLAAIASESARLEEEAGKMGMTFARAGQQMSNAFAQFVGGQHGGAMGSAAEGLSTIAKNMDAVGSAAIVAAGTFAAFKLASWASTAALAVAELHPVVRAVTIAAGAALAVFEGWGKLKELLPKSALDNSLAGVKAISDELAKANVQIAALSKEQVRVLKVRAQAELGVLEGQIKTGQGELLGMTPGSAAYREKEKALNALDAQFLKTSADLKELIKNEDEAGTKAFKAAMASADLQTKAGKRNEAIEKARQAMVTGLMGTDDPRLQQQLAEQFFAKEREIRAGDKHKATKEETALDRLKLEGRAADAGIAPQTLKEIDALNVGLDKRNISYEEYLRLAGIAMANDPVIAKNAKVITDQTKEQAQATALVNDYRANNEATVKRIAAEAELAQMSERQRLVVEAQYKAEEDFRRIKERIIEQVKDETAKTEALAAAEAELAIQKAKVSSATANAYDAQRTFDAGWNQAFQRYQDEATNAAKTAETVFTSATDAMVDAGTRWATGQKVNFENVLSSFAQMIIQMQMKQAAASIVGSFNGAGGVGGFLGSLFNGGNAGAGSMVANTASTFSTPVAAPAAVSFMPLNHGGGIAGFESSSMRLVPHSLFAGATRYHTGAIAGDEVPTILRRGEGVFTEGQMKALSPAGGGLSVTINNNGTPQRVTGQRESVDSRGRRSLALDVEDMVAAGARRPGSAVHNAMRGTFAAEPALVGR